MPTYVFTDEEILAIVVRQPLPITVRRFVRIMNGRIKDDAARRRLNNLVKKGLLLSRKFRYSHTIYVKVFGSGSQMEDMDTVWKQGRFGGKGLAEHERDWYL
jgi:hypothetical protein